ncbi:MAG TPA: glycosyltransferase family 87 protein [Dehalococcoidales bacterium]|nr:glycosyltransferase family 87 protein [Dehalococcoidales bacterium]
MPRSRRNYPLAKAEHPASRNKGELRPVIEFLLFGALITAVFFLLFQTIYRIQYTPTGIFFDFATSIIQGQMPYRDFALEYPPFSLLFFILPRLLTDQWIIFSVLYQMETWIFALLGLWYVYKIARRLGKSPWQLMAPYTAGILVIGPIIGQQYDIFPAVMTLISVYYFWTGKHKTAWIWLALGVMTKLYPAVLAPVYLIIYLKNRQIRPLISGVAAFGIVCLSILLPFLIAGPQYLMSLVDYHSLRNIQLESLYSSILLVCYKTGLLQVSLSYEFGSWNLAGSLANILTSLSVYVQGASLLLVYFFIWRQVKPGKSQFTRCGLYFILVLAVLLFTSKVFSPQYIIWLLPALPLVFSQGRRVIWTIFGLIGILTYLIFPVNYLKLLELETVPVILLFLRNILLVAMAAMALKALNTFKSSG